MLDVHLFTNVHTDLSAGSHCFTLLIFFCKEILQSTAKKEKGAFIVQSYPPF